MGLIGAIKDGLWSIGEIKVEFLKTWNNLQEERYSQDLEKRMKDIKFFEFSMTDKHAIKELLRYWRIKENKGD